MRRARTRGWPGFRRPMKEPFGPGPTTATRLVGTRPSHLAGMAPNQAGLKEERGLSLDPQTPHHPGLSTWNSLLPPPTLLRLSVQDRKSFQVCSQMGSLFSGALRSQPAPQHPNCNPYFNSSVPKSHMVSRLPTWVCLGSGLSCFTPQALKWPGALINLAPSS